MIMKRWQAKEFIEDNVIGSWEAQEMLMVNRTRLYVLVETGRLYPIKELKREFLFYRPDVENLIKELLEDSRSNLYKKHYGEPFVIPKRRRKRL
jgi:hypothetical protein